MIRLGSVPCYEDLYSCYGDPDSPSFAREELTVISLPYPLRINWDRKKSVSNMWVHRMISSVMQDALREILNFQGYKYLIENDFDLWGGTYNNRKMRGSDKKSTHAWGIAIDLNPDLAPYNEKDDQGRWVNNQPAFIRNAFIERGFVTFPWDGMHFQAADSERGIKNEKVIEEINSD